MENRPLVKFIRNYIRDSSGVFSISSLVRISMTSFPAFTLFVQNTLVYIIKRKLHGGLKIRILFSRGKKQYFTYSLRSFVKYRFYHSKIKFISSRRRVISSIYNLNIFFVSWIKGHGHAQNMFYSRARHSGRVRFFWGKFEYGFVNPKSDFELLLLFCFVFFFVLFFF